MSEFDFTEDEICEELKKLGYVDIPKEKILQLKRDLEHLAREQNNLSSSLSQSDTTKENSSPNIPSKSVNFKNHHINHRKSDQKPNNNNGINNNNNNDDNINNDNNNNNNNIVIDAHDVIETSSTYSDNSNSTTSSCRLMKRKILRKIDGRTHVEESFTTDDSTVEGSITSRTSYARSKSVAGSVSEFGTTSVIRSAPTEQLTKLTYKCDPVKRYHEYKSYWAENLVPGEKQHKQLRWDVREFMSHYVPVVNKKPVYQPVNSYVSKKVNRTYINEFI